MKGVLRITTTLDDGRTRVHDTVVEDVEARAAYHEALLSVLCHNGRRLRRAYLQKCREAKVWFALWAVMAGCFWWVALA